MCQIPRGGETHVVLAVADLLVDVEVAENAVDCVALAFHSSALRTSTLTLSQDTGNVLVNVNDLRFPDQC